MKVLISENKDLYDFFFLDSDKAPIEEFKYVVEKKLAFSFLDEINNTLQASSRRAEKMNIRTSAARDMAHEFGRFVLLSTEGLANDDDDKVKEALLCLRNVLAGATHILKL